jgi:8-oxo-dGTP pyrophosphatase MutT (NUDIX family)
VTKLDLQLAEQAAAVPYRIRRGRLEIALVTSRRRTHWVVPKGSIEPGEKPRQSALREALEEAGVIGELHGRPLGSYVYEKERGVYRVRVFLLRVTRVLDRWPERRRRDRTWVPVTKAAAQVRPELRDVLTAVRRRVGSTS